MDRSDKEKLTRNLSVLAAKTTWNPSLEAALLKHKVFSRTLLEPMLAKNEGDRSHQLFLDVQKRGPRAFAGLLRCLLESGNYAAARVLDPSVEEPPARERPNSLHSQARNKKVWNEPTYEGESGSAAAAAAARTDVEDVEMTDDRTPVEVNVVRTNQYKGPPSYKAYPMTRKPRGMALIIDNEEFDNDIMTKREGSQLDANNLDILFEQLGFRTIVRRNLAYSQMTRELSSFSALSDHADADMCVVCILSHGNSGLIYSTDGREVSTEWVLRKFNNDGCPALKGKPKFFILQACRGDEPDYGFVPRLDTPEEGGGLITAVDAQGITPKRVTPHKDPTWEDMLIAYATVPGYVANRNLYRGTWFVECLCQVFMTMACDTDIREMLDEVSGKMRYYESEFGTKQSCSYEVRHFYKKLFFNPGIYSDDVQRGEGDLANINKVRSVTTQELAESVDNLRVARVGEP